MPSSRSRAGTDESAAVRRMRQLQLVSAVAVEISAVRTKDELLWEVVHKIQSAFGYYYVHISTIDRERNLAVCRAGWDNSGPRRDLAGWGLRLRDQGLVGWVAWSGQPELVGDVTKDQRYYLDERFPDTRSEVTVPILHGDRPIGVLDAQDLRPDAFDGGDLLVLETLARQISVALENAELFEQLAESQAALQQKATALDEFVELATSSQENDRRRIALDLHDGAVQLLVGAHFEVETLRMPSVKLGPEVAQRLEFLGSVLKDCSSEIRRVIFDLYPHDLARLGLVPTVQRYQGTIERLFRRPCAVSVRGEVKRLAPSRELAAFRFIQEALANAFKHAEGAEVDIVLEFSGRQLGITVGDKGPGFDTADRKQVGGFGLRSMQHNAARAKGTFGLRSTPGTGTTVTLTIPLEEAAREPDADPAG